MDNNVIELVGGPCGHHGPYTFYKAFKYSKKGSQRIISLCEFFFVKLWSDSDLVCIGELQLLWVDKNSEQMLASLRLYFLPENTPEGRMDHGEDEVLAITEKVVLRLEDLLTWITVDTEWSWGRSAIWETEVEEPIKTEDETPLDKTTPLTDSTLDFSDVDKERKLLAEKFDAETASDELNRPSVIVLSYPRYCRYRALMRRLEGVESTWLRHSLIVALGGFATPAKNTRVLFCRDTFDYPDLEGHELLCNHLAPKLKGRPRGKRKKRSISPGGSESNESEASVSVATVKTRLTTAGGRNGLRCNSTTSPRRSARNTENLEERDFLKKLHVYMKSHRTPIGRVPSIGYKEIDLFALFNKVQKLGGYDSCTANRLWKSIFDELGGHHNSTSAATIMRRHYERLLLSYERHIKGEEHKPLPVSERRRLKSKTSSFSDAETSENDRSSSGKSTPVPSSSQTTSTPSTPATPTEFKEFSVPEKTKSEGKPSSLRSVRVKPDRLREAQQKDRSAPKPSTSPAPITTSPAPITISPAPLVISPIPLVLSPIPLKMSPAPLIISSSSLTISPSTPEKLLVPCSPIAANTSSLPEKNSSKIPVTSAVAPVVEKTVPEKSVSPLEGKENIPILTEPNVGQTRTETDDDVIEIPYKPKTPEIIDLDAEPEPSLTISNNSPILYDVKKRKLDILKEGGLEVTAITGYTDTSKDRDMIKDNRASVIQHSVTPSNISKTELGNLSITVTSDARRMPPPVPFQRSQSPKKSNLYGSRPVAGTEPQQAARLSPAVDVRLIGNKYPTTSTSPIAATIPSAASSSSSASGSSASSSSASSSSTSSSSASSNNTSSKPVLNGTTPPKVLQSRSIYSYSERTVYGNPKDPFMPPPHTPQAPRHLIRSPRPTGGEVLDLTVKSPQKPIVEIVRIPHPPLSSRSTVKEHLNKAYMKQHAAAGMPLFDTRVGSNLEITLVSGNGSKRELGGPVVPKVSVGATNHQRHSQKRSSSGRLVNHKSSYENGRPYPDYPTNHHSIPKNGTTNLVIPSPHNGGNGRTSDKYDKYEALQKHLHQQQQHHHHQQQQEQQRQQQQQQQQHHHHQQQQQQQQANAAANSFLSAASPLFPGYLSQFAAASKGTPYLPVMDPLYYSALAQAQGFYPTTSAPMFPPVPTVDQLQLYKDIMAHSVRGRFPFSLPPESINPMSITANGQNSDNPNLMKK